MSLRQTLKDKPAIGWTVAGILGIVALFLATRSGEKGDSYSTSRMTEMVTIKFTDTGDTIEMPRGRLIRDLMLQGGRLDPEKGITNPKTGQPTGFIFDTEDWKATINQINSDKEKLGGVNQPGRPTPKPAQPPTAPGAAPGK